MDGAAAVTWLNSFTVALDTETTGVDVESDRIVTACIGYAPTPGKWEPSEWLINPGVQIPEGAIKVHGIDNEKAATGQDPVDALTQIHSALTDIAGRETPVVGHNLTYDLTILDREFRRHLGKPLPDDLIALDTLVLFRRFDFTTGGKRLEDLAYRNGIKFPVHDATADALASLRLLHILAASNDLLPHVPVRTLRDLQAKWHAAHQEAARAKRVGNGQSGDGFSIDWPIRPYTPQEEIAS